jgi:hypothetical protein
MLNGFSSFLRKLAFYPTAINLRIATYFARKLLNGPHRWYGFSALGIPGFGDELVRLDFRPSIPAVQNLTGGLGAKIIASWLEQHSPQLDSFANVVASQSDVYASLPDHHDPSRPRLPWQRNAFFGETDTKALMAVLKRYKPNRYVEIGSGMSTRVAAFTRSAELPFAIHSIDPNPRVDIAELVDEMHHVRLEALERTFLLDLLQPGDVLFIDGSHRVFPGSDVVTLFLDVVPFLKPGVIVHVHDVYLPDDYPLALADRLWSEQYLLASFILAKPEMFAPIFSSHWYSRNEPNSHRIDPEIEVRRPDIDGGSSLWLRVTEPLNRPSER